MVGFTSVLEEERVGWGQANGIPAGKNTTPPHVVLLSQFIILPPFQGLGLGSALLKLVYDYYIKQDKLCVEFSVEEPSDEFQSLMDQIELKMIWQNGFFKSIKKLFKNKKSGHQFINIENFD